MRIKQKMSLIWIKITAPQWGGVLPSQTPRLDGSSHLPSEGRGNTCGTERRKRIITGSGREITVGNQGLLLFTSMIWFTLKKAFKNYSFRVSGWLDQWSLWLCELSVGCWDCLKIKLKNKTTIICFVTFSLGFWISQYSEAENRFRSRQFEYRALLQRVKWLMGLLRW